MNFDEQQETLDRVLEMESIRQAIKSIHQQVNELQQQGESNHECIHSM